MKYAANTNVPVERSKAEIEAIVLRYGATGFISGWQDNQALITFEMRDRRIRFLIPLPDRKDARFWRTPARHHRRNELEAFKAWEQACRQKWRALLLAVKAKMEAVESGISTFEEEFLAHIVLSNGATIGESILPNLAGIISSGKMLPLLPSPETTVCG